LGLAAAQRYTHTLMFLGYLRRDEHKRFRLAHRVLSLGYSCLKSSELHELAETCLKPFSQEINCTVNLGVLQGEEVLVLFRHEVERFFKFDLQPGSKLPAFCTSLGKVLLAALDDQDLGSRITKMSLEPITPRTITDPQELLAEISAVRKRGISESDGEASLGLYSAAVPVLDQAGCVVAAANVSLSRLQVTARQKTSLKRRLLEQGREFSVLLGYQGKYPQISAAGASHPSPANNEKG
jgi:IclR family pca regulon transcriptional regulator